MIKLTNENVRTLPGRGSDVLYADSDKTKGVPGLYLRIREGGSRSFVIQWREGAGQRRAKVGKVGVLSLDDARTTGAMIVSTKFLPPAPKSAMVVIFVVLRMSLWLRSKRSKSGRG